jgi:hypothetical protein
MICKSVDQEIKSRKRPTLFVGMKLNGKSQLKLTLKRLACVFHLGSEGLTIGHFCRFRSDA